MPDKRRAAAKHARLRGRTGADAQRKVAWNWRVILPSGCRPKVAASCSTSFPTPTIRRRIMPVPARKSGAIPLAESPFCFQHGHTGTIVGTGQFLKEQNPHIQVIGCQPEEGSQIASIANGRRSTCRKSIVRSWLIALNTSARQRQRPWPDDWQRKRDFCRRLFRRCARRGAAAGGAGGRRHHRQHRHRDPGGAVIGLHRFSSAGQVLRSTSAIPDVAGIRHAQRLAGGSA